MSNLLTAPVRDLLRFKDGLTVLLAVGNNFRSDDGAGPYIASLLESNIHIAVINAQCNPENTIDEIIELKPQRIIIIDAADFNAAAGEARLIDKEHIPQASLSTHAIPLRVLAGILEKDTAADIKFIGIQPKSVDIGEELCDEVKRTADAIVEKIKKEFYHA